MRALRRIAARVGVAASVCALAACGGAASSPAAEPAPPTATTAQADSSGPTTAAAEQPTGPGDTCALLTDQQIVALSGTVPTAKEGAIIEPEPGKVDCYWSADGRSLVTLQTYSAPIDVDAQHAELKSGLFYDDDAGSAGVGEDSFYRLAGPKQVATIVFRQGGTVYYLALSNPTDTPVTEDHEAEGRKKLVVASGEVIAAVQ